jgi:biopolymer transport protein ExbB
MLALMTKYRVIALSFVTALPFVGSAVGFAETTPQPVADQAIQSAVPPIAATPGPPASGVLGLLPSDLSPWGMFLHADIVVKLVICGLALASIVTWTIWLAKSLELAAARRRLRRAYRSLREAQSLALAEERLGADTGVARALVRAAREEWHASTNALDDRDGLKERIALHLERIEAATGRRMMIGTGILATIGSTAPFIGLFGTVWGIMNSFIGISKMHTTNLAVVAPGIAEALLATAIGLVAAIPAVVIYNHFARQIAGYKALVADAASAVMRLASRDLSHGVRGDAATRTLPKAAE